MGAKASEVERMLKAAGFVLDKTGRHLRWRKGDITFTTHGGGKPDRRELAHARATIRAAEGRHTST